MRNFWGIGAGRHRGFDFPGAHKESGAKVIAWGHRNQQTLGWNGDLDFWDLRGSLVPLEPADTGGAQETWICRGCQKSGANITVWSHCSWQAWESWVTSKIIHFICILVWGHDKRGNTKLLFLTEQVAEKVQERIPLEALWKDDYKETLLFKSGLYLFIYLFIYLFYYYFLNIFIGV